jgi:cyclophilin family peptidyl-prolyl cis-trans isomerase
VKCLAIALAAVLLAGCGGNGDDSASPPTTTATSAGATTGRVGANGCRDVDQPQPRSEGTMTPPGAPLDRDKHYLLDFRTNCGDFTVALTPRTAPRTTASLVALARADFFDGTSFHRIVPGFVIQGGDPTGTGSGGPGYSTVDTPAVGTTYTKGVVAMAKTAQEAPGTAGSQFFVVTGADAGLPPDYAVVGKVVDGMDVVSRIGKLGDPSTELPTRPVVIEDVAVRVS